MKELITGPDFTRHEDWMTNGVAWNPNDIKDETNLFAGDVRVYQVHCQMERLQAMQSTVVPSPPTNCLLFFDSLFGYRDRIRKLPSFFDWFVGIAVDWKAVLGCDPEYFTNYTAWMRRHKLTIAVFTGGADDDSLALCQYYLKDCLNLILLDADGKTHPETVDEYRLIYADPDEENSVYHA